MATLARSNCLPSVGVGIEEDPGPWKNNTSPDKPVVCIFDPLIGFHWPLLESCFGDLVDLLDILRFDANSFSKLEIDRGSIGPLISMDYIIGLEPVLIISDLTLAPYTTYDCRFGIKMLTNLFSNERLDQTGLILISNFSRPRISETLAGTNLKFRAKKTFDWDRLKKDEAQRTVLHNLIFEAYAGNIPDRPNMNRC